MQPPLPPAGAAHCCLLCFSRTAPRLNYSCGVPGFAETYTGLDIAEDETVTEETAGGFGPEAFMDFEGDGEVRGHRCQADRVAWAQALECAHGNTARACGPLLLSSQFELLACCPPHAGQRDR